MLEAAARCVELDVFVSGERFSRQYWKTYCVGVGLGTHSSDEIVFAALV